MTRLLVADELRDKDHVLSAESDRPLIGICDMLIIRPKRGDDVIYSGFAAYKVTRVLGGYPGCSSLTRYLAAYRSEAKSINQLLSGSTRGRL